MEANPTYSRWWTPEQQTCPHERTEFDRDDSSGAAYWKCIACRAIIDGGMIGHN